MKCALAAVVLVACTHDDPPAQPHQPTTYEQLEQKLAPVLAVLGPLQQLADASDCAKLAAALRKFGDEHGVELEDVEKLRAQLSDADRLDFENAHDADAKRMTAMIHTAERNCPHDDDVRAGLSVAGFRRKN